MEVIYGLLPLMLLIGMGAVGIFFWAARSGQFEDMEGEASRILMDEDLRQTRRDPDLDADNSSDEEESSE